jgi:hypothetical protein
MKKRRWLGIALIALGLGVLLLAPIAPTTMTVELPAETGPVVVSDFHTEVTPLGIGIGIAAVISVIAGIVVLVRSPNAR